MLISETQIINAARDALVSIPQTHPHDPVDDELIAQAILAAIMEYDRQKTAQQDKKTIP